MHDIYYDYYFVLYNSHPFLNVEFLAYYDDSRLKSMSTSIHKSSIFKTRLILKSCVIFKTRVWKLSVQRIGLKILYEKRVCIFINAII